VYNVLRDELVEIECPPDNMKQLLHLLVSNKLRNVTKQDPLVVLLESREIADRERQRVLDTKTSNTGNAIQ
jgi:hypothetical protein